MILENLLSFIKMPSASAFERLCVEIRDMLSGVNRYFCFFLNWFFMGREASFYRCFSFEFTEDSSSGRWICLENPKNNFFLSNKRPIKIFPTDPILRPFAVYAIKKWAKILDRRMIFIKATIHKIWSSFKTTSKHK